MIYKDANVTYDINSRRSDGRATNIQFMTQDTGSAKLSFSFTKDGVPLPLSAVDAKIVLLYPDGSFYKRSLTLVDKVNGKAEYILSDGELKHPGIVKAELKLYYTNGQALATSFFTFTISKTLEDQNIVPVAEYYIDDFEMLRDEISQTLDEIKAKFDEFENIETKTGAQEKADVAEDNAKAYADVHANNKTIHITADERTKWNKGQLYKLTQDNGMRIFIPEGTDLLTLPTGFYYGANDKLLNNPDPNDAGWFNYDIMVGSSGRKTIIATASYNNKMWFATVHTNGDFKGWKRFITDADTVVSWQTPTLLNGWEQYDTVQKVRFSKNVLGEVEIIGAIKGGNIGIDVSVFKLPEGFRPLQPSHFIGVASSSGMGSEPQFHRTLVDTDGKVCIQSCSNTVKPNAFIVLGFKFKSA
ncbi:phage baseplate upper protein [Bacillus subtilis]|uniref:phage baseplate upper protein n=2 Tax=Bacillus subtilis TaxID=1423 RepID=UPI00034752EF|nr:phage baseplate upper protein [Bacillus subtilis]